MRTARKLLIVIGAWVVLCTGGPAMALVGNGYTVWGWGTTNDTWGIDIGSTSDRTCVLSGVAGNLNVGGQWYKDVASTAGMVGGNHPPGDYWLVGHGGAYTNQVNDRVWQGNPVNARATCFWTATNVKEAIWQSSPSNLGVSPAVKIADSAPGRQCFLGTVDGVAGSWSNGNNYAEVYELFGAWYVAGNLPSSFDGSHAMVDGRCADFPAGTVVSSPPSVSGPFAGPITTGTGVKACGLTKIQGAFTQNNWDDGALIQWPASIDGNWTMTVSGGKRARYTCVK